MLKEKNKIKAVLFDLGKVILDFDFKLAFRRLSKKCPHAPSEIESYFLKSGLEVLYDGGKISSAEFYRIVKKALKHSLGYQEFKKIWNGVFTLNQKNADLVRKLKSRYRLVLISNTNAMHYDYIRNKYSVLGYFDSLILSYREKVRKPDERIYRKAIQACRAAPREILYIDDRPDLTEAAGTLGFHTFTFRDNHKELLQKMERLGIRLN